MYRALLFAIAMACLTACASLPPNPIDPSGRGGLFVKAVDVSWAPINAPQVEDEAYLAGKTDLMVRLKKAVADEFRNSPAGSEAVTFDIKVIYYSRVGAAMGNIVGGSNAVFADVDVVRDSDGKVLGTYKRVSGYYASNAGVIGAIAQSITKPDIVGIMANKFTADLRKRFEGQ